ncbi:hypothetical protein RB614_09160 [Phytohabitans sp. ZYX-F-186]|uniref:Methyltransferase domain-containing protein n=1 Tax=Phytohabitans maris TaxID=3071409 RepID=A0ABU0ZCI1_9ACTN|nr:hypothetical protein [Phytohabitans sp. ZYX-F-186]MDQ7904688.1 hypothetical protein [Phytohabitans sp. ZYX-F-186]
MIADQPTCVDTRTAFDQYLVRRLPPHVDLAVRSHLDQCDPCWQAWDRLRWDRAAGTTLHTELVEYLGDRFKPYHDSSRTLAQQWDRATPQTHEQVRRFYSSTDAYLYNQVIWHASGHRPRYVDAAKPLLTAHRDATIIDYGCGIGEDVLALHRAGFLALGCDLPSPPTDFFTWRSHRHGYPHPVYQPEHLLAKAPILLWIMDTLDHLPDLTATIGALLNLSELVICENLLQTRHHGRQGFHHYRSPFNVDRQFAAHGLSRLSATPPDLSIYTRHRTWR